MSCVFLQPMFAVYSQDVCGTVVTSFLFVCCLYVCSLYNEGDCKQCSLCVPLVDGITEYD